MFTIDYGDTVEAACKYDYSGPAGYFTFAMEIGTIIVGSPLPEATWNFNTLDRWETQNIYISPGTGKTQIIRFKVQQVGGLDRGTIYDLNWEIGQGSKGAGTWKLLKRLFTNDEVKITEAAPVFSNLTVSYKKI